MSAHSLMLAAILVPLATALLIVLTGRWPNLREAVTLTGAVALAAVAASLIAGFDAATATPLVLAELLPGFTLSLRAEPIGLVFAGVAAGLWGLNSLYSIGYMRAEHAANQTRFYACFAVSLSAAMAIALAGNLATLFVAYEVLTLATYPLVVHWQTEGAIAGARRYLGYLLVTSLVPFLGALAWTWTVAGTLDFTAGGILNGRLGEGALTVLLLLYAYGVGKAALMPLHGWLPSAMVAPTPVSALLHAVAVVKAGVFTLLKIAVYIFGLETIAAGPGDVLVVIAAASVIAASLIAMTKDDLKARLAYSTVAQLAMVTLAVALAHPLAIAAGILQTGHACLGQDHPCSSAPAPSSWRPTRRNCRIITGIGAQLPLLMLAFLFGALSVAGLPPFGGMWPKYLLVEAALDRHMILLVICLGLSTLLTLSYLIPIVIEACFRKGGDHHHTGDDHGHGHLPLLALLPPVVTGAGCLVLFLAAPADPALHRPCPSAWRACHERHSRLRSRCPAAGLAPAAGGPSGPRPPPPAWPSQYRLGRASGQLDAFRLPWPGPGPARWRPDPGLPSGRGRRPALCLPAQPDRIAVSAGLVATGAATAAIASTGLAGADDLDRGHRHCLRRHRHGRRNGNSPSAPVCPISCFRCWPGSSS